eukprot:5012654-Pleurochrysis_carterae.AAC.2
MTSLQANPLARCRKVARTETTLIESERKAGEYGERDDPTNSCECERAHYADWNNIFPQHGNLKMLPTGLSHAQNISMFGISGRLRSPVSDN